jgi:hypothetical protein
VNTCSDSLLRADKRSLHESLNLPLSPSAYYYSTKERDRSGYPVDYPPQFKKRKSQVLPIEEGGRGGGDDGDDGGGDDDAHGVCGSSSSTVIVQDTRVDEGLVLGQVDLSSEARYNPLDSCRLLAIEGSATEGSWLLEAFDWCEHLLYKAFNYFS